MQFPTLHSIAQRALHCVLLTSLAVVGAGGCDEDGFQELDELEDLEVVPRKQISTWYEYSSRKIYARGAPKGTYNALITSKTYFGGTCENQSSIMSPVPQKHIETEICAGLGLIHVVLSGGVNACVTTIESNVGVPVYSYNFTSLNTEVNYRVIDLGANKIYGDSGWQPSEKNGCPRDGFSY